MGLHRPRSWFRTLMFALLTAVVLQSISEFVTGPLLQPFLHHSAKASPFRDVHSGAAVFGWLGLVWTFAAFGEEIGYRGYLLNRAAEVVGSLRAALVIGLLWSSVLFGFGHWHQGPAGVVGTAVDGLVLGTAYLLSGRNLWVTILAHGFSDTYAIAITALGLAT